MHKRSHTTSTKIPDPAGFRIHDEKMLPGEDVPEDLLVAFEKNYRSELHSRKRIIITATSVLFVFVLFGGWYLVKQKPELSASTLQQPIPPAGQITTQALIPPVSPPQPPQTVQKPVETKVQKIAPSDALPAFIPRAGHDKKYAAGHPGWESYAGKQHTYRVFKEGGKLKAVQIIAGSGKFIPSSLVSTVLTELAGTGDYRISSRENKSGFLVLKGIANDKANLIFYKKGEAMRAFVVSLR